MSRLTNAILGNQAFGNGSTAPMLDVTYGGQFGWAPDLTQWVSNQAYIRRPLVCILLEAPRFFQLMPNPTVWVQTLKSLFELTPTVIEGMNATIEVEWADHPVGGAGEIQQEVTDVKRTRSEPTFTWIEKYGRPIQNFLQQWITYGMMDPETKYAMIGTLSKASGVTLPSDMLADWFTASALFYEPDPTHTKIVKSWVTTNMMPKGTGEIIAKRDLNTASELTTLNITFSALSQYNLGSNVFAQNILSKIAMENANPYLQPSFLQNPDSAVASATTEGYREGIAAESGNALQGVSNT